VAVLQRPEQTANQYYKIAEQTLTQNQLLRQFEEETGAKFEVTRKSSADVAKLRDEKLAKKDPSASLEVLLVGTFADGAGMAAKDVANAALGLQGKELKEIVRDYVKSKSA
jgi:hypothetical protein